MQYVASVLLIFVEFLMRFCCYCDFKWVSHSGKSGGKGWKMSRFFAKGVVLVYINLICVSRHGDMYVFTILIRYFCIC